MHECSVPVGAGRAGDIAGGADLALSQTLRFLSDPAAYLPRPLRVEAIETHMSWVFLTDAFAYKLKKPVRYPFLDFSTLAAREADCRDELRLNRRLAPGVYLGLTRLQRDRAGRLMLADENGADATTGEPVDWLVRMRRLPAERTLEHLIRHHALQSFQIDALGRLLGSFYGHLPPADLDADAHVARLQAQHALNLQALGAAADRLDGLEVRATLDGITRFLATGRALLGSRATDGRVVEGHGDLRPEHVFMLDPPVVIDCLEFSRELRLVDWADEIASLGIECERLGADGVGTTLRNSVSAALADPIADRLFDFHAALRACLRARLALAHLDEAEPRTPERWPRLAADYLRLAGRRVARLAAAAP